MKIYEVKKYVPKYSEFVVVMKTPHKIQAVDKTQRILRSGVHAYVEESFI